MKVLTRRITSTNGTYLETLTLTTSGGSGTGAMSFAVTTAGSAGCSVSGDVLTVSAAGTCSITATKATDARYLERSSSSTTITIAKAVQQPLTAFNTWGSVGDPMQLSTTGGSGTGAVTYAVTAGSHCAITGSAIRSAKPLNCTVVATKATDSNFLAVSSAPLTVRASPRLVVITAPSGTVDMGQPVGVAATTLGMLGAEHVDSVELRYEGTTIRGEHYGPSALVPTLAGTYTVQVVGFTLSVSDPSIYSIETRPGTLVIHWAALPITDPALVGLPLGGTRPTTVETTTPSVQYSANGAAVAGPGWQLELRGVSGNLSAMHLVVGPGGRITITGTGYQKFSPVRIFMMSTPVELGTAWTDTNGKFTLTVTVPTDVVTGSHELQINGYNTSGAVRSASLAVQSVAVRAAALRIGFHSAATALTNAAVQALGTALSKLPSATSSVRISVSATAQRGSSASRVLAQHRAKATAKFLVETLAAQGISANVTTRVRTTQTSNAKLIRTAVIALNW